MVDNKTEIVLWIYIAWGNWECYYSSLDRMLVSHNVTHPLPSRLASEFVSEVVKLDLEPLLVNRQVISFSTNP